MPPPEFHAVLLDTRIPCPAAGPAPAAVQPVHQTNPFGWPNPKKKKHHIHSRNEPNVPATRSSRSVPAPRLAPPRNNSPNEPISVVQPQEKTHVIHSRNEPNVPGDPLLALRPGPQAGAAAQQFTKRTHFRGPTPRKHARYPFPKRTQCPRRPRSPRPSPVPHRRLYRASPPAAPLPAAVPTPAACHNGANGGDGRGRSPISVQSGSVQ